MPPLPYLFAALLALLCLGFTARAHAGDARTSLGVRLVIIDSCDIHVPSESQRRNGGNIRIACPTATPYALSFSQSVPPTDPVSPQEPAPAAAFTPENLPAVTETPPNEFDNPRDIPVTTVTF